MPPCRTKTSNPKSRDISSRSRSATTLLESQPALSQNTTTRRFTSPPPKTSAAKPATISSQSSCSFTRTEPATPPFSQNSRFRASTQRTVLEGHSRTVSRQRWCSAKSFSRHETERSGDPTTPHVINAAIPDKVIKAQTEISSRFISLRRGLGDRWTRGPHHRKNLTPLKSLRFTIGVKANHSHRRSFILSWSHHDFILPAIFYSLDYVGEIFTRSRILQNMNR